jgi:hypothetical protein
MTPAERMQARGQPEATLADVVEIEAVGIAHCIVDAYMLLADGRHATWQFVLGGAVGQDQRLTILPGE